MSRLLLFTNEYPYRTGDVVFVEKEIPALIERFDDIVVFCHARDTSAGMIDLPNGVRFGGNLFDPAPEDAPRRLLEWGAVGLFLSAAWLELCSGRLLRHPKLFVLGAKVGITQAHREAVREAIAGADDVVAYGFWAMGGGLGVPWLRGIRARVVRAHGYDLYEERMASGYLPFRPFLYRRADRILTISEDGARYIRRKHRGARGKVIVSRLGVTGPAFAPHHEPEAGITVVSCSSVIPLKRVPLILAAMRALAEKTDRRVHWVHFGDGPQLSEVRATASDSPDNLTVALPGRVANEDVLEFYRSRRVDVFVNASTTEGVPVSIMEAIAHGIPVVATSVGGTPEIVGRALRTGQLVGRDPQPDEIADAIRMVVDAPDDRFAPRETWEREYAVQRTSERAAELVRTAVR